MVKNDIVVLMKQIKDKMKKEKSMSTRAVYTFVENDKEFFPVYVHHDGYPSGAASKIVEAFKKAWPLPRFEADEFAAAFIAANKDKEGSVRLTTGPQNHSDLDYVYEIFQSSRNNQLCIRASKIIGHTPVEFYYGRLKEFIANYADEVTTRLWNTFDPSSNKLPVIDQKTKIKNSALSKLTDEEKQVLGLMD